MRLLALADPDQHAGKLQRRRAMAAAHLYAALHSPLGQGNKRVALSLLLRAASIDSWWMHDKVIVARLYERFFGAGAVETLFRVNRWRRRWSAGRS